MITSQTLINEKNIQDYCIICYNPNYIIGANKNNLIIHHCGKSCNCYYRNYMHVFRNSKLVRKYYFDYQNKEISLIFFNNKIFVNKIEYDICSFSDLKNIFIKIKENEIFE